ncbi:hypothetical protein Tco_0251940 [Tanacetum coccineum]
MSHGLVGKALSYRGSCFCEDVTRLSEEEYPLVSHASMSGLTSCFAIYLHSVGTNDGYVLVLSPIALRRQEPYIMQTSSVIVSDECSSTNTNVTFTDAGETSSYLKQGIKRKRGSDETMVLVTLKNEEAKRFKLKGKMIGLKYTDEENGLILVCVDKDLEDAMVASGSKLT